MNTHQTPAELLAEFNRIRDGIHPTKVRKAFKKPLIIVSTPRAGSTLLFETLARCQDFWSIGGESHIVYSAFPHLQAENAQFDSGCLGEQHANKNTIQTLRAGFLYFLRNYQGKRLLELQQKPPFVRLLEKTPRNALNIPFLNKIFPSAQYIFLFRDPRQNISSIIDAWERPNFITYPNLPGWSRGDWHLLLPPGWRKLNGKSVADIAAFQWRTSNLIILKALQSMPSNRWLPVSYASLLNAPGKTLQRICKFAGVRYDTALQQFSSSSLPLSSTTVSPPDPEKWRKHEAEIGRVLPSTEDVARALEALQA